MLHTTLMILKKDGKILLGLKKRGFGLGKLNGVGGKLEKGETVDECVVRETFEEIGVRVTGMEHMADIVFDDLYYKGVPERNVMHVYVGTKWTGKPVEFGYQKFCAVIILMRGSILMRKMSLRTIGYLNGR